jgi:hypothetical protein
MTRPTPTGRRRGRLLRTSVVVASAAALLAACGGSDDTSSDATTTASAEDATTTTTPGAGTIDGASGETDAWTKNATEFRGQDGTLVEFDCTPDGTLASIWGTETYTDDSSVCTAAVHVGLITVEDGGTVTIEIQPGQDSYVAGEANGVASSSYGAFEGSFTFPDAPPGSGQFAAPAESWSQNAAGLAVGDSRELECSPDGTPDSVWGTGTFTADSSICTAAVLEGLITLEDGGPVRIVVVEGQDSYTGSEANGVTSEDYASYSASFEFPADQPSG